MNDANESYKIGQVVDDEKSEIKRLTTRQDGKFASTTGYVVVDDSRRIFKKVNRRLGEDELPEETSMDDLMGKPKIDGDTLFSKFKNRNEMQCFNTRKAAENSARGLNTRYCLTKVNSKNWNTIRLENYSPMGEETYSRLETGRFVPVKLKIVAVPENALADECKSFGEYKMKCELKNIPVELTEEQFIIYKY